MRYSGIVHITGEGDTGKTRMALQNAPISRTAYFYDDVKRLSQETISKLGLYVDLVQETKGLTLLKIREYILKKLDKIKPNQYDAIVFDTSSRLGLSLRQYAILNPQEFREMTTFSKLGSAKGGEMWGEAHRYEAQFISDLSNLAPFVCLITHLKDVYEGGAKVTGMKQPDAGKSLDRVCNFRVWLRKNPNSGVPIALVLKRLAEDRIVDDMLETVNVLPWKLTPKNGEGSVWDVVDRYRANPFGNRSALPEETPDAFEMSILTGIMTKEQNVIWQANLKEKEILDKEELVLLSEEDSKINERIKALFSEGMSIVQVTAAINNEFGTKFDFAEINRRKE